MFLHEHSANQLLQQEPPPMVTGQFKLDRNLKLLLGLDCKAGRCFVKEAAVDVSYFSL
ncbi:MAG: hypothetical protein GX946_05455 [Oligosphaeraceae bacterium]|nr:hypothetical protein [Oligosphaeraceae bacterium]